MGGLLAALGFQNLPSPSDELRRHLHARPRRRLQSSLQEFKLSGASCLDFGPELFAPAAPTTQLLRPEEQPILRVFANVLKLAEQPRQRLRQRGRCGQRCGIIHGTRLPLRLEVDAPQALKLGVELVLRSVRFGTLPRGEFLPNSLCCPFIVGPKVNPRDGRQDLVSKCPVLRRNRRSRYVGCGARSVEPGELAIQTRDVPERRMTTG